MDFTIQPGQQLSFLFLLRSHSAAVPGCHLSVVLYFIRSNGYPKSKSSTGKTICASLALPTNFTTFPPAVNHSLSHPYKFGVLSILLGLHCSASSKMDMVNNALCMRYSKPPVPCIGCVSGRLCSAH